MIMMYEQAPSPEKAAMAYQKISHTSMSGFEIVVALYEGIIKNIEQAKNAYLEGKLDHMCNLNDKTYNILIALQSHLDFEKGGEEAQYLNQFYNSIFTTLSRVLRAPEPAAEFDKILIHIQPVYKRWIEFAQAEKK